MAGRPPACRAARGPLLLSTWGLLRRLAPPGARRREDGADRPGDGKSNGRYGRSAAQAQKDIGQVVEGVGVEQLKAGLEMELVLETIPDAVEPEGKLTWKWKPVA